MLSLARSLAVGMAIAAVGVFVGMASPARAHVVYGTTTLRLLILQADLVARVRILDPALVIERADPPLRETVVVAEVLEILKGGPAGKELRFVRHGHGIVAYSQGEEVLLFVERVSKNAELRGSGIAEHAPWVSRQETGAKYLLEEDTRDEMVAAVRTYAVLETLDPSLRPDALRRITAEMLASPNQMIASSALRDVVLAGDTPIFSADDLPVLEPLLDASETPIGIRIGLLADLERRGLVVGPPRWSALLRTTSGSERLAVVRAAGAHPSEAVTLELTKLVAVDDARLVAAAAISLGSPGNDAAVTPLAGLLASNDAHVRMAAIRGLGRVGSPAATRVLAHAAASHPDSTTRRRAAAEVKVLGGRGGDVSPVEDPA